MGPQWAVLDGAGNVWEVCPTLAEAESTACWLVDHGALVVTVQAYDETGAYLPADHGC